MADDHVVYGFESSVEDVDLYSASWRSLFGGLVYLTPGEASSLPLRARLVWTRRLQMDRGTCRSDDSLDTWGFKKQAVRIYLASIFSVRNNRGFQLCYREMKEKSDVSSSRQPQLVLTAVDVILGRSPGSRHICSNFKTCVRYVSKHVMLGNKLETRQSREGSIGSLRW